MAAPVAVTDLMERLEESFTRLSHMETRVSSLEDSVNSAVGEMMPKVELLLSGNRVSTPVDTSISATTYSVPPVTLIELAERGDDEGILEQIMEKHIIVHETTKEGDSALHIAASRGHLKSVVLLLSVLSVDLPGYQLCTPLHCAAANGHLQVAQRLVDAGAQIDAKDAAGNTAIALASKKGHKEITELLVRAPPQPLRKASLIHSQLIQYLHVHGLSSSTCVKKETLLLQAAKSGQWEFVDFLLERGLSPTQCNVAKESALVLAARAGEVEVVRHLLRHGASSSPEQVSYSLGEAKNAAVVWVFLERMPDVVKGIGGMNGLRYAAVIGRVEALMALLDLGVEINCRDNYGNTPLSLASSHGNVACVMELLRRFPNINIKDHDGFTPLHWAAKNSKQECLRVLLQAGANTAVTNNCGKIPEMYASEAIKPIFAEFSCIK